MAPRPRPQSADWLHKPKPPAGGQGATPRVAIKTAPRAGQVQTCRGVSALSCLTEHKQARPRYISVNTNHRTKDGHAPLTSCHPWPGFVQRP
jgi:hypothetical protein